MKISTKCLSASAILLALLAVCSCNNKKFHVDGTISDAKDSVLYLENISLDGPKTVGSVRLDRDGTFRCDENALDTIAPEFYRLRIANQIINLSIDSTETVSFKASYPTMSYKYDVKGSDDCSKIKELSLLQMNLQGQINAIEQSNNMGVDSTISVINQTLANYKNYVKVNYIFKQPYKAYAYFALFQTIFINGESSLIFNPRNSKDDVQVFAAVATSWDSFYPGAERGKNLHSIAIEGMKNIRIMEKEQAQKIEASKVSTSGIIDLALEDNKGNVRRLSDLKGKVVMLDFNLFQSAQSLKRIMMLRDLYNKYHAQGFEIYQVSVDSDEHLWKTQTAALPWINVRDKDGMNGQSLVAYNVQQIPTFFLIDRNNILQKRDIQIKNLDAEIKNLLK